jgi:hypothetical protein
MERKSVEKEQNFELHRQPLTETEVSHLISSSLHISHHRLFNRYKTRTMEGTYTFPTHRLNAVQGESNHYLSLID